MRKTFDELPTDPTARLNEAAKNHYFLNYEYQISCSLLAEYLKTAPASLDEAQLGLIIKRVKDFAELLETVQKTRLGDPYAAYQLKKAQIDCQQWTCFFIEKKDFVPSTEKAAVPPSVSYSIQNLTNQYNWIRLLFSRSRRVLLAIHPVLNGISAYRSQILTFDRYTGPFFGYFNCFFFAPRLTNKLALMAKHLLPGTEEAPFLGWSTRLLIQLERHWSEVWNDANWVVFGLINTFVLVGSLAPWATLFSFGFQAIDTLNATLKLIVELHYFHELKTKFEAQRENPLYAALLIKANQRLLFEKIRLSLGVINATSMLVCLSLALPFFAINPWLPLIGALLAVAVTLANTLLSSYLDNKLKPSVNIQFFKPATAPLKTESGTLEDSMIPSSHHP